MIAEVHPAPSAPHPPARFVAAANAAGNPPSRAENHALAGVLRQGPLPGGPPAPASQPGLGGRLDLYASSAQRAPGLQGGEPGKPPPVLGDIPYLKPLADPGLGNRLNTRI